MSTTKNHVIGVVHPGLMGISVANALIEAGHRVCWCSENRSAASAQRAGDYSLHDCETLAALCNECDFIFSVCPPAEALVVARAITECSFNGVYVDCNAVSPATGKSVAQVLSASGAHYVDGGIIGPPAWSAGTTRLYLSGPRAAEVTALFEGSLMGTVSLGEAVDAASAMKMAYAGWTKGSAALLLSLFAMAEHHGLGEALKQEWALSQPGLEKRLNSIAQGNAPKAWRFIGEMQQIAATMEDAGQHPGAFESAVDVYAAMADFKSSPAHDITVEAVIRSLISTSKQSAS